MNARDLHTFLESGQQSADWAANRIKECQLVEGVDFGVFDKFIENPQVVFRTMNTG